MCGGAGLVVPVDASCALHWAPSVSRVTHRRRRKHRLFEFCVCVVTRTVLAADCDSHFPFLGRWIASLIKERSGPAMRGQTRRLGGAIGKAPRSVCRPIWKRATAHKRDGRAGVGRARRQDRTGSWGLRAGEVRPAVSATGPTLGGRRREGHACPVDAVQHFVFDRHDVTKVAATPAAVDLDCRQRLKFVHHAGTVRPLNRG